VRILIVEDDKDLNRQLAEALEDQSYVVDRAYDGEEGHFLGDTEPYDAVILDIGLTGNGRRNRARKLARRGAGDAGADPDRTRPLERQGGRHRRRRR
jgi:DNA-binding response OmpR family regulator